MPARHGEPSAQQGVHHPLDRHNNAATASVHAVHMPVASGHGPTQSATPKRSQTSRPCAIETSARSLITRKETGSVVRSPTGWTVTSSRCAGCVAEPRNRPSRRARSRASACRGRRCMSRYASAAAFRTALEDRLKQEATNSGRRGDDRTAARRRPAGGRHGSTSRSPAVARPRHAVARGPLGGQWG
jgi:hypothetical protein